MSASHRNSGAGQLLRAILQQTDDSGPQQLVKVTGLAGQTLGEAVRSQHFGLTSHAPADAEGLGLLLGGGMDRAHLLGLEHPQHRPRNLVEGATRLYDKDGNMVHIENGTIKIIHATRILFQVQGVSVIINANGVAVTGGKITHNGHDIGSDHLHTNAGGAGLSGPPQ